MATNFIRLFSSLCIRKTVERQHIALPVLCSAVWCQPCSNSQSNGYHISACLYGGRPKSEWRRKRAPAWTKLSLDKPEKSKTRKAYGGGRKTKITRAKKGLYLWKSQNVEFESLILDVLHNTAHKDFTENKIMVKGSIVEVDAERFRTWFDKQCEATELHEKDTQDGRNTIEEKVLKQIKNGRVLAKVSSRPGQEGKVDGYLLEGAELNAYLDKTEIVTSVVNSKT